MWMVLFSLERILWSKYVPIEGQPMYSSQLAAAYHYPEYPLDFYEEVLSLQKENVEFFKMVGTRTDANGYLEYLGQRDVEPSVEECLAIVEHMYAQHKQNRQLAYGAR